MHTCTGESERVRQRGKYEKNNLTIENFFI